LRRPEGIVLKRAISDSSVAIWSRSTTIRCRRPNCPGHHRSPESSQLMGGLPQSGANTVDRDRVPPSSRRRLDPARIEHGSGGTSRHFGQLSHNRTNRQIASRVLSNPPIAVAPTAPSRVCISPLTLSTRADHPSGLSHCASRSPSANARIRLAGQRLPYHQNAQNETRARSSPQIRHESPRENCRCWSPHKVSELPEEFTSSKIKNVMYGRL
jgi:hypothetical protein